MNDTISEARPIEWQLPERTLDSASFQIPRHAIVRSDKLDSKTIIRSGKPSIAEVLFQTRAEAKIWTSQLAMRLPRPVRERLFRQIDRLHDVDEWMEGDVPLVLESYQSFVRTIVAYDVTAAASLALSARGNLYAMWGNADRLTIEFLPGNRLRWLVVLVGEEGVERAAGETTIARLREVLGPYQADKWLSGG
ncbi:MAG TPA: hypothetical protein VI168_00265 [Croceibacterium sp.]